MSCSSLNDYFLRVLLSYVAWRYFANRYTVDFNSNVSILLSYIAKCVELSVWDEGNFHL